MLLALVWLAAQTFLAWHAPSHLVDYTKPGSHLSASLDCKLGVNGHGVAAAAQAPSTYFPTSSSTVDDFVNTAYSSTIALSAQARAPPTLI